MAYPYDPEPLRHGDDLPSYQWCIYCRATLDDFDRVRGRPFVHEATCPVTTNGPWRYPGDGPDSQG